MTKENNKTRLRVERTVDGKPASDDTASMLAQAKAKLLTMEERSVMHLRADRYLWGIYAMLLLFSVVEVFSASSSEVNKAATVYHPLLQHIMYLCCGFGMVVLLQNIHYKYYRKFAWVLAGVAIALVFYANHHGVVANGAMRAISLFGFTIQPPEIAKLALVVALARIMAKHQMRHGVTNKGIFLSLAMLATFGCLLYSNGLTNTVLILIIASSMFVIGGAQARKLIVIFTLFAIVGGVVVEQKFGDDEPESTGTAEQVAATTAVDGVDRNIDRSDLRKDRIKSFLEGVHPGDSVTDENRQVVFAKMSQSHGGWLGNGPGNSRESARLPLAFSDYIYSIIIEDTGFVGGVFLLVLYLLLLARAGMIAAKCTKAFPALLITGCATLIVSQALIHMAIVVGLAPVSGQPLPFISKGGTSIIVMSAAMGMMLSVSKYAIQRTKTKQDANLALKQAVEDSSDTSANPTMLHADVHDGNGRRGTDPLTYSEPPARGGSNTKSKK